jgi:hypothetical protein
VLSAFLSVAFAYGAQSEGEGAIDALIAKANERLRAGEEPATVERDLMKAMAGVRGIALVKTTTGDRTTYGASSPGEEPEPPEGDIYAHARWMARQHSVIRVDKSHPVPYVQTLSKEFAPAADDRGEAGKSTKSKTDSKSKE